MSKAAPQRRRPPVGAADLLAYFAIEKDVTRRRRVMQVLHMQPAGIEQQAALQESQQPRQLPPQPPPPKKPPESPVLTARDAARSLRMPHVVRAQAWHFPPAPQEEDIAAQVHARYRAAAAEVQAAMARPTHTTRAAAPLTEPRRQVRRLRGSVTVAQGQELNLDALLRQLAQGRGPYPYPLCERRLPATRWWVVLDDSPALQCFAADFERLVYAMAGALGWGALSVSAFYPGRPGGPKLRTTLPPPLYRSSDSAVLVLSDLGASSSAQTRQQWAQQLTAWRAQYGALATMSPVTVSVQRAPDWQRLAHALAWRTGAPAAAHGVEDVECLLMALSPAISVDAALVRCVRLALFPRSNAALEQAIWRHPDLAGDYLRRRWHPHRQQHHLQRLAAALRGGHRAWAPLIHAALAAPDRVAISRPSDLMQEVFLLGQACFGGQGPSAEVSAEWSALCSDFHQAVAFQTRMADYLLGLEVHGATANGDQAPAHTAASTAERALTRLPPAMRTELAPLAEKWHLASAFQRQLMGLPVAIPEGVEGTLAREWSRQADARPSAALPVVLRQRGERITLESRQPPSAGQSHPSRHAPALDLAQATITGSILTVSLQGRRAQRHVSEHLLPIDICGLADLASTELALQWPTGAIDVLLARRPRGIAGWLQHRDGRVEVRLPKNLCGCERLGQRELAPGASRHVSVDLWESEALVAKLRAALRNEYRHMLAQSSVIEVQGHRYEIGVDRWGVYLLMHWGRDKDVATQRLRYIEPGVFMMGSTAAERAAIQGTTVRHFADASESPQHGVTLTRGYWLADTPCTQAMWEAVMGSNPSEYKKGAQAPRRPVENVSWDDAQLFLKRVQQQLPPGWEAALPTEAQWEYAARAGSQTAYWWGDEEDSSRANWNDENKGTTPVERYEPNPWGLHDMHGNVWEWCEGYRRKYTSQAQVDPSDAEDEGHRALRGGSWLREPAFARAAFRGVRRGDRWRSSGLRLALRSASQGPAGPA